MRACCVVHLLAGQEVWADVDRWTDRLTSIRELADRHTHTDGHIRARESKEGGGGGKNASEAPTGGESSTPLKPPSVGKIVIGQEVERQQQRRILTNCN